MIKRKPKMKALERKMKQNGSIELEEWIKGITTDIYNVEACLIKALPYLEFVSAYQLQGFLLNCDCLMKTISEAKRKLKKKGGDEDLIVTEIKKAVR